MYMGVFSQNEEIYFYHEILSIASLITSVERVSLLWYKVDIVEMLM